MSDGVSIIILVYNGGETFIRCLDGINSQKFSGNIDIVIVDSGSTDGSIEAAKRAGARVSCIENKDFHHSRTRNSALQLARFEKIIYLVQDAIPVSAKWLSQLCESLEQEDVASVSVLQIPHADAEVTARFEVEHHGEYMGEKPHIQYVESPDKFSNLSYDDALYTIRHDNVCSIYRRNLLEQYPFPDIEYAEDMAWAHAMLMRGYKILYNPKIAVRHSHNRPPEYRFKRSVVNSIACAKILGRVKEDISYLKVSDAIEIRDIILNLSAELKKHFFVKPVLNQQHINIARLYFLLRKFAPILNKIRQLSRKFLFSSDKVCNPIRLQQAYGNHIRFVVSLIMGRYSLSSFDEYSNCIDQITASTLGRFYGEFYSGHMLKGTVPREVEDLVQPYRQGV
jgi:glycosyltransferase involved in cell wall biosynthesis